MENASSHRIHNRIAIVDYEVPDFMGLKNGIYLSSLDGKSGNVLFFENGMLKYKTNNNIVTLPDKIVVDDCISIGSRLNSHLSGCVVIGDQSGESLTCGNDNLFYGRNIAREMTEGSDCISFGANSLKNSSAIGNSISIGENSMGNCGKTEYNIGIGKNALENINDSYNIGIGINSGRNIKGPFANHNMCFGRGSMENVESGVINIIAFGSNSCSDIRGNNFQSIYGGDKVAQRLKSDVISINNVCFGNECVSDAFDISDVICIGTSSGKNITGVRTIILGAKCATETSGVLSDEIIIGTFAGASRKYSDSHNILLGTRAGYSGDGLELIAIGNSAGENLCGNNNNVFGKYAGQDLSGDDNLCFGFKSGMSLKGKNNICIGSKSGLGLDGSNNILLGEGPVICDSLESTVAIGSKIFVKGKEAIVIGSQVGKSSIGYLNRDILIGANAGMGQNYNNTLDENKGILLIGANAGFGDPENPNAIDISDLVCLGHSSAHSNEQNTHKTLVAGNYAGSYATKMIKTVALGHSAGVGMHGEGCVYVGPHSGFNVKGNNNIFIGSHCGDQAGEIDAEFDDLLAIGNANRYAIYGDLKNGNLLLGATNLKLSKWTDSKGTLGFHSTERPTNVSSSIGGVLYANGKHLEFTTDKRTTNLTFPYKFICQGELNGTNLHLNTEVDGSTLLTIKIAPSSKQSLCNTEQLLLLVSNKICKLVRYGTHSDWSYEILENKIKMICTEDVKGICVIEAIGVHVCKAIKE